MTMEKRTFRGLEIRDADGSGMTIAGRCVPFGEPASIGYYTEQFDRDCTFDGLDRVKMTNSHGSIIGVWSDFEQREDGLWATGKISDTTEGRDVAQLIRDKAIDSLSVGFDPIERTIDANGIVHRRRVRLNEVAVTGMPAYSGALITDQRSKENEKEERTMDEEMRNFMDTTRKSIIDLGEKINRRDASAAPIGSQWRNAGEYIKAMASGDKTAADFMLQTRDLITSSDAANQAAWVGDMIHLVESRRSIMDLVTRAALPEKGMTVEFSVLETNTATVSKQSAEGAALPYGEVSLGKTSVGVETYGGYTKLSRQVIDRSTSPTLETAIRAMVIEYAKKTAQAVRDYIGTAITGASANKVTTPAAPASMTADQWIDVIVDAAEKIDDNGAMLGTLAVSKDVFKALAKITRNGDALMDVSGNGPTNLGSVDITGITGRMLRVPVKMISGATANLAALIDPNAITVWESGGPFQLQSQDIINLGGDYSVYGYLAIGTTYPAGITPLAAA